MGLGVFIFAVLFLALFDFMAKRGGYFYEKKQQIVIEVAAFITTLFVLYYTRIAVWVMAVSVCFLILTLCLFVIFVIKEFQYRKLLKDISIIPIFKSNLKLYQMGTLLDGRFCSRDILATVCQLVLQKDKSTFDEIENHLYRYAKTEERFLDMYSLVHLSHDAYVKNRFHYEYTKPVYDKLVQDGYFRYNPKQLRHQAKLIASSSLMIPFIIIIIGFSFSALVWNAMLSIALITALSASLIGIYSYAFHEKAAQIVPIQRQILGFKMYLKTVDYYKISHDAVTFEQSLPYLISFRIMDDKVEELVEYVMKKIQ